MDDVRRAIARSAATVALIVFGAAACSDEAAVPNGSYVPGAGGMNGGTGAVNGGTGAVNGGTGAVNGGTGAVNGGTGGVNGGTGGVDNGTGGMDNGTGGAAAGCANAGEGATEHFSFFVTSVDGMRRLSGSPDGFGGDLRYGEADGLAGADKICTELAESAYPGAGCKTWRAFLSVTDGGDGNPVHAKDRIGEGPWYDRVGRLVANNQADLLQDWPEGADPAIRQDLPNEFGVPNHDPDGTGQVDNHNTLTGTKDGGLVHSNDWAFTCHDWTSSVGTDGTPAIGFSWYGGAGAQQGSGWYKSGRITEGGCAPYINLTDYMDFSIRGVGARGGYGGIYCLALTP